RRARCGAGVGAGAPSRSAAAPAPAPPPPAGIQPTLGPLATPIGEVYRYTLKGQTADPLTLRTLQDWVVRPALLRVPGVADVVSHCGLVKEIHVTPDPVKMATRGVGLTRIFTALSAASHIATG